VYLQTSKDIYETEEDVWFKGYVLDAQTFSPSQKNKTLYVQLTSEDKKNIFWKEKYEIENGFVDGHIFLQDSLKSGKYLLSAYSQHSYFKSQKEFYNPVYDKESVNDSFPDYRKTLFWKSNIITDTSGEASISFFCSDISSNFIWV